MDQGPPRWLFDLILKTEITWSSEGGDSDYELIKHPMIINSFSENFNITENNSLLQNQDREMETGDYTTYNFPNPQQEGSTFYLPKIWSLRSTTGDSFSDILQNWLTMRGISVPPVHPVARQLSHDSPQSNFSLQDFVNHKEREVNLGPLQLNLETPMGYRSKKKYGSTTINSEVIITDSDELGRNPNIIQNVLKAYIGNDSNFSDTLKKVPKRPARKSSENRQALVVPVIQLRLGQYSDQRKYLSNKLIQ